MDFLAVMGRIVELDDQRDAAEALLRTIGAERDELERQALARMVEAGVQNQRIHGRTLYIHSERFPKIAGEADIVHAVLREMGKGWDDLVQERVNAQSLRGRINEYWRNAGLDTTTDDPPVPELLAGLVEMNRVTRLRSRKA